jgi:hypothetical protein
MEMPGGGPPAEPPVDRPAPIRNNHLLFVDELNPSYYVWLKVFDRLNSRVSRAIFS